MSQVDSAILLSAKTSSEAIKRLFAERKQTNAKLTLQALCDAAKITSTGYLSDVMQGRRKLHLKYRRGVARALGLEGIAAKCLSTLVARDHERSAAGRVKLDKRLTIVRKAMRIARPPIAGELRQLFFATEVFCAFGLFRNQPSDADLVAYFGEERKAEVNAALAVLERLGAVGLTKGERYELITDQVLFGDKPGSLTHPDFLRMALRDAGDNVDRWFPQRDDSHFASSIISVDSSSYRVKLKALKTAMLMAQADMESGAADQLVRFNVQIYPLVPPKT